MAAPVLRLVRTETVAPASSILSAVAGLGEPGLSLRDRLQARGLSRKTVNQYARAIHSAEEWCQARGHPLSRAPGSLIARYADTLPNSASTRRILRCALKHYWEITHRKSPPLSYLRVPPTPEMVCKAFDDEEARRLAKLARQRRDRKGFALALGLYQAMRREEIARCRWVDFGEDGYLKIVGKGDKQRVIPIHPEILDKLTTVERAGDYVFPGRQGGHVGPTTVWAWIKELGEEAGVVGITTHRLRHTCLAVQNDENGDLRATQQFAGHSKIQTTEGYTRTRAAALRKAMLSVDYLGDNPARRHGPPQRGLFDGPAAEDW